MRHKGERNEGLEKVKWKESVNTDTLAIWFPLRFYQKEVPLVYLKKKGAQTKAFGIIFKAMLGQTEIAYLYPSRHLFLCLNLSL